MNIVEYIDNVYFRVRNRELVVEAFVESISFGGWVACRYRK